MKKKQKYKKLYFFKKKHKIIKIELKNLKEQIKRMKIFLMKSTDSWIMISKWKSNKLKFFMIRLDKNKLNSEISFINMKRRLMLKEKTESNYRNCKCKMISLGKQLQDYKKVWNSSKNKRLNFRIKMTKLNKCKKKWLLLMNFNQWSNF